MNRYKMINRIINEAKKPGIMLNEDETYVPVVLRKRKFSIGFVKELLEKTEVSKIYYEDFFYEEDWITRTDRLYPEDNWGYIKETAAYGITLNIFSNSKKLLYKNGFLYGEVDYEGSHYHCLCIPNRNAYMDNWIAKYDYYIILKNKVVGIEKSR